jgi:SAM-dependent methyltransferase
MPIAVRGARDLQRLAAALNEGKGTAYERYALDRFFEHLADRLELTRVLEMPANGVMGVPGIKSLALAARGVAVTLAVPLEAVRTEVAALWDTIGLSATIVTEPYTRSSFAAGSFDLVWNFCVYEHVSDPAALLREMVRVSRRYVLVLTQNPYNPGIPVHRLYHQLRAEPWDHGEVGHATPRRVVRAVLATGARIVETGGIDLPPWPDINMQLRPPSGAGREDYDAPYAELRPGVIRQSIEVTIDKIRALGPRQGFWPRFYRAWHELERRLPRQLLRFTAHHPYVLAEVPPDTTA